MFFMGKLSKTHRRLRSHKGKANFVLVAPRVKMDGPHNRDCEQSEYGKMMGFDNREGRKKMSFQVTKKLIKEFGKY